MNRMATRWVCCVVLCAVWCGNVVGEEPGKVPQEKKVDEAKPRKQADSSSGKKKAEKKRSVLFDDDLPEIIVIGRRGAAGVPVAPFDGIGSRDVFGPEQIRETGARDVNDLILNLPAISTRPYNGGETAAPSFSARGLPDDGLTEYLNVLIDGVPAGPMPYSWTAFSFLPVTPERLYALDYIRGAHSVRYSPNTVGGVLNFITQPIPSGPSVGARSTYGSYEYISNMAWAGTTTGNLGGLITFVDRRGDGFRHDGEFDQQDMNLKLRLDTAPDDFLAVSLSYMENAHRAPGGLTVTEYARDRFGNTRRRNRFDGYRGVADVVYHNQLQGEKTWFEGFTYYSQTKRRLRAQRPHFTGVTGPATLNDWNDTSHFVGMGLRAEHEFEMLGMPHTLYGGFRYEREWIPAWTYDGEHFTGGAGVRTQDNKYNLDVYSFHLDDTVRPIKPLKITGGVRFERVPSAVGESRIGGTRFHYDDSFFAVLPGVGASFEITDKWAVYGNYFEGFRAPQAWGFGLTDHPDVASMQFERSNSWELGSRTRGLVGLSTKTAFWRNRYDNFGVFYSGFYENLGKIEAEGVDLEAKWDAGDVVKCLEGFSVDGSITFQNSKLKSGPNQGNDVPYAWGTKAAWRARYEFGRGWLISLGGTYVGDSFSDEANTHRENATGNLGRNASRLLWDGQVRKEIELGESCSLRFTVGATNLLDKEWYVHSRGGFFGGGKVAGAPRQGYGSIDLTFKW